LDRLGEILVKHFGIKPEIIEEALRIQSQKGLKIGEILLSQKIIDEETLLRALAIQFGIPFIKEFSQKMVDSQLIKDIPIHFCKKYSIIPLRGEDGQVFVGINDPTQQEAFFDVLYMLNIPPNMAILPKSLVFTLINLVYNQGKDSPEEMMEDLGDESLSLLSHELEEPEDILDSDSDAPAIRLVNMLLAQAVKARASDIHIEPFEKELSVRFRIDGVLYEIIKPPKRMQASIVSRIKVLASLNIAEKRLPQDGRIKIKIAGKDVDIRLSIIPTMFGERIVMRLLDKAAILLKLEDLGFGSNHLGTMKKLITKSHGIILVTGPTGSGKTTTLYAALSHINSPDKNIITVEDPVEYQLQGIGQIQVSPKIQLTFANGLRSILRQDPDVIMVGEIRDAETAEIAIQASLTGHLVFSTLHTNDAPSAITRLIDMGVESFLISSSVIGILAQRLVRLICPKCKKAYVPKKLELEEVGISTEGLKSGSLYAGESCNYCMGTGYKGRIAIYEILIVNDDIRELIMENKDASSIKHTAVESGMVTLKEDGKRKVVRGITTTQELLRVTGEDII